MNADQQARSGERGAVELTTKYTNHTKSICRKRAVQRAQGKRWGEAYWQAGSDRVNAGHQTQTSKPQMDADERRSTGAERGAGSSGVNHEIHESHEINLPQKGTKTAKEPTDHSAFSLNSGVVSQEDTEGTESERIANEAFEDNSCRSFSGEALLSVNSVCSCSRSISGDCSVRRD